jgi:hypothetical protein
MSAFNEWFAAQGFRHFGPGEFTAYFARERKGAKQPAAEAAMEEHRADAAGGR